MSIRNKEQTGRKCKESNLIQIPVRNPFIENLAQNRLIEQAPGYLAIKDLQSKYLISSQPLLDMLGFKSNDVARGKSDFDLQCAASENAESFIKQDQSVIETQREIQFISVGRYADGGRHIFLAQKKPIFDEHGVMQAFWANGTDITHQTAHYLSKISLEIFLQRKHDAIYELDSSMDESTFTKAERKIIFLLVHGYNPTEIAAILHRSKRTVETHLENLRNKLQVCSTPEMVEYLNSSKYANFFVSDV